MVAAIVGIHGSAIEDLLTMNTNDVNQAWTDWPPLQRDCVAACACVLRTDVCVSVVLKWAVTSPSVIRGPQPGVQE